MNENSSTIFQIQKFQFASWIIIGSIRLIISLFTLFNLMFTDCKFGSMFFSTLAFISGLFSFRIIIFCPDLLKNNISIRFLVTFIYIIFPYIIFDNQIVNSVFISFFFCLIILASFFGKRNDLDVMDVVLSFIVFMFIIELLPNLILAMCINFRNLKFLKVFQPYKEIQVSEEDSNLTASYSPPYIIDQP